MSAFSYCATTRADRASATSAMNRMMTSRIMPSCASIGLPPDDQGHAVHAFDGHHGAGLERGALGRGRNGAPDLVAQPDLTGLVLRDPGRHHGPLSEHGVGVGWHPLVLQP